MVFPGRTRGRGVGAKGGGIHATTRKSSSGIDRSRYREHERSLSPPHSRPATVEDRLGAKYPNESSSPPTESLRITVGNDIFKKGSSPLSDRLGPPVQQYQNSDNIFERERMFYGGAEDIVKRDDKWRRDSQGKRYDTDSHGRDDDRGRDRRRESGRDSRSRRGSSKERPDSRHDRRDSRRDGRDYRDRREGSREGHRSDSHRREESRDRDYHDHYRSDVDKKYDERFSSEKLDPQYGDRIRHESDKYNEIYRERGLEGQNSMGNYYRRGGLESLTQQVMRSPPKSEPTLPTAKPLKSILKKKTDNVVPPAEMSGDPYRSQVENRLGPPLGLNYNSAGTGHSMDIEDEERFLYGEPEKKEPPPSQPPPWSQSFTGDHFQPQGGNTQQGNTFPILGQPGIYSSPPRIPDKPCEEQERQYDSSDLLSIFMKRPQPRVSEDTQPPSSQKPASFAETLNQEVKQQKYDPTIENILKSIGFDFEMSKRMQEKAGSEPLKEDVPQQYGINQMASFLGGGLSTAELSSNLFPKKKPPFETLLSHEARDREGDRGSFEGRHKEGDRGSFEGRHKEGDRGSFEGRHKEGDKGSFEGRHKESFLDQILSKDVFSKRDSYLPPLSSVTSQEYVQPPAASYTSTYAPYSQEYAPPVYTKSYLPAQSTVNAYSTPPVVDSYNFPQYTPPEGAPSIRQMSPGLRKAPEISARGNLTTISLAESVPELQKSETSKKNTRPNLREIPKSFELVERMTETPLKNTVPPTLSSRTVLPPKGESVKSQRPGIKRPVEKEPVQSMMNSKKQAEKLLRDKEERQKRIHALEEELTKLRKQQNEIMRKKRRQKDGHKDPILLQNSQLQEEISLQISKLRKLSEGKSVEDIQPQQKKIKVEKEEVRMTENMEIAEVGEVKASTRDQTVKEEVPASAALKEEVKLEAVVKQEEKPKQLSFQVKGGQKTRYEFFDPGKHWCKLCNTVYDTAIQFLEHTHQRHNKKWKNTDTFDRPWIPDQMKNPSQKKKMQKVEVMSMKGPEFLFPTNGFYCVLCREFSGDVQCAEFHLKTEVHHTNYQKFLVDSPFYEQRRQLDRAKGLAEKQEKTLKEKESKPLFGRSASKEKNEDKQVQKVPSFNLRQSEKEVEELSDVDSSAQSSAAIMAKVKLSLKKPIPKPGNESVPPMSEKEASPILQSQTSVEEAEKKTENDKKEDGKKGIAIKITNKIGIVGKVPAKKNALLPPWTPVSRQDPLKNVAGIEAEKNKLALEKKQVTAQDILKALQEKKEQEKKEAEERKEQERKEAEEKKEQERKEAEEKKEQERKQAEEKKEQERKEAEEKARQEVTEIPVPEEKPSKKEENPVTNLETVPDLSSIPIPSPPKAEETSSMVNDEGNMMNNSEENTSDANIQKSELALEGIVMPKSDLVTNGKHSQEIDSDPSLATQEKDFIQGPSMLNESKAADTELNTSVPLQNMEEDMELEEEEVVAIVPEIPQKDDKQECDTFSTEKISTSPPPSNYRDTEVNQAIIVSECKEKEDSNHKPQPGGLEDSPPPSNNKDTEVTQAIIVSESREKEDSNYEPQPGDLEDSPPPSNSKDTEVTQAIIVSESREKEDSNYEPQPGDLENSPPPSNSKDTEVTQAIIVSESREKEDSNYEPQPGDLEDSPPPSNNKDTEVIIVSESKDKEGSNHEPQPGDSEDVAIDIDDDKTITDEDNTLDNSDVLEFGEDDMKDREGDDMSLVQRNQCRPIEDVIEVSMGSLGDVVEVAVGGENVNLEGDLECNVDQLYGVIGGESENLEDVLSVGQGQRGAGCFSELGVKPMDVEDVTTAGGMNEDDVGNIVDELMHSNSMESENLWLFDPESEKSGISGMMGSDFEVVDECEET
ncbi:zinc finger protein 318-like isoform X2 [Ostrea edulis]|uniref:zinc finger protein 318-like isoform X2 n=1 Tax=Ostrea edulis TaxID=37623 RepID=UPI0024AF5B2C|nr:zinc finger protein 318-like isoform X2 [Ostrea edulis]